MKLIRRLFMIYCVILFMLLVFKLELSVGSLMDKIKSVALSREQGAWNMNLVPFKTISSQLRLLKTIPTIAVKNLAGNIVVFVPFGFLLPSGYETMRKCHKTFLAGLLFIFVVETVQLASMLGSFDIDDIILNCLGVLGGYIIFKIFGKIPHNKT